MEKEHSLSQNFDFDVAVIGAGPGGSSAAAALVRNGRSVVLIESENFPRFHIGESLLPMSNQVFQHLGCYEEIIRRDYPKKWAAIFYDEKGSKEVIFDFSRSPQFRGTPTYHVPRAEFDQLLLDHAIASGTKRVEGKVRDAYFDTAGVTLNFTKPDQSTACLRVKAVLDASGRSGFLAHKFQLRQPDPTLKKAALYAHFQGVPRPQGRHAGSIRIVATKNSSWVWLIPLPNDVMSIGVVMDLKVFKHLRKGQPEETLQEILHSIPAVTGMLGNPQRISPVHIESSFSYGTKSYVGDRWLMVGDAGSFLDPVFSSGVMFALFAGVESAKTLERAFSSGDFSVAQFASYDRLQQKRYRFFRRFVRGFYKPHFRDLFYHPTPRWGMLRAVVTVLGGAWDLSFADRMRIGAFFQLVKIQRYIPLAPRLNQLIESKPASNS